MGVGVGDNDPLVSAGFGIIGDADRRVEAAGERNEQVDASFFFAHRQAGGKQLFDSLGVDEPFRWGFRFALPRRRERVGCSEHGWDLCLFGCALSDFQRACQC